MLKRFLDCLFQQPARRVLKHTLILCFTAAAAFAEVHPLTLRQAVDLALKTNPDLMLARLDEQKAQTAIRIANS